MTLNCILKSREYKNCYTDPSALSLTLLLSLKPSLKSRCISASVCTYGFFTCSYRKEDNS